MDSAGGVKCVVLDGKGNPVAVTLVMIGLISLNPLNPYHPCKIHPANQFARENGIRILISCGFDRLRHSSHIIKSLAS